MRHLLGTPVRVHVNLNRGDFTVSEKVAGKGWRKVSGATDVTLSGVTFTVSEATRLKVVDAHCRAVHAWAFGTLEAFDTAPDTAGADRVTYNPFRGPTFTVDGSPIHSTPHVTFTGRSGYLTTGGTA